MLDGLELMQPITLDRMNSVKLMNRVDTKFVANVTNLPGILKEAAPSFYVFEAVGSRELEYDTIYFDTDDLQMYHRHHNGLANRKKVRTRLYVDSQTAFLEVKNKNNHGRTKKKRIEIDRESLRTLDPEKVGAFLLEKSGYATSQLIPALETRFNRITLVNKEMTERVTIDFDLTFENLRNGCISEFGPLMVVEIKQDGLASSRMTRILQDKRIHPLGMSKYCIGSVLTCPELKHNRFKQRIRTYNKLKYATTGSVGI